MTKEIMMLLLTALIDKIEREEIRVESYESTANDEAGHVAFHWLKLPRPATVNEDASEATDMFKWKL